MVTSLGVSRACPFRTLKRFAQQQKILLMLSQNCNIYICYLPAGRSVLEKCFVEVSKTARDRRSRDVFETETKYFSVQTDLNGK